MPDLSLDEITVFLFADKKGYIPFSTERTPGDEVQLLNQLGNLIARKYIRRYVGRNREATFYLTEKGMELKEKLEDRI